MPRLATRFVVGVMFLALSHPASAVVINSGNGTGNTTAPTNDPGWANVGKCGVGSAIYLQDGWVLTAYHVGANTINFGGTNYAVDASQATIRITDGDGTAADLILFRITGDPVGVADLVIADSTPAVGDAVTMIGYGRDRATSSTTWYIDINTNPYTWSEKFFFGCDDTATGYKTGSDRTKRWGTNNISDTDVTISNSYGTTTIFRTEFNSNGDANECQAAVGDSGGAVFIEEDGTWYLAGMMDVVYTYSGQPSDTAVYGNLTGAMDLSLYRDNILSYVSNSYVVPEPASAAMLLLGGLVLFRRRAGGRLRT